MHLSFGLKAGPKEDSDAKTQIWVHVNHILFSEEQVPQCLEQSPGQWERPRNAYCERNPTSWQHSCGYHDIELGPILWGDCPSTGPHWEFQPLSQNCIRQIRRDICSVVAHQLSCQEQLKIIGEKINFKTQETHQALGLKGSWSWREEKFTEVSSNILFQFFLQGICHFLSDVASQAESSWKHLRTWIEL